jgi:apolipoprotein N-acyltransferase
LVLSAALFALSFPNFFNKWGFFPLAFIAITPVFIVVHRSNWIAIPFYGLFYGFVSYALFNFWLVSWHPLAIFIVPNIYASYFLIVLPVLKIIDTTFPVYGFLLQPLVWLTYEYLRTLGFLGYCYGIIGYSQYQFGPLIQIASITGVWGVSLIVIFPSVFLGNSLKEGWKSARRFILQHRYYALGYGCVFGLIIIFGLTMQPALKDVKNWRVALIQQNVDPWKGGDVAYEKSLNICLKLSQEALMKIPDIIVWSETSFVPGIRWYTKYQNNLKRWSLVRKLIDFLSTQSVPYVIGNNDAEKRILTNGKDIRVDYNATLLYQDGVLKDVYRKLRLVPFSEHFPYRGVLNWMYELLLAADIHFYGEGDKYTIFNDGNVKFATPICFEDTFGYLNREFVRKGAQVLVNMTNDSWSFSVESEMQHMSMAVFRAVENRRSVVRSANGGITCVIDPMGRIQDMLEPFKASYLISNVPIYLKERTVYTSLGDWLAYFACLTVVISLVLILIKRTIIIFKKKY